MSALTAGVQRPQLPDEEFDSYPMKGSTTIYQGGLVMVDTSGYAHPGAATAADIVVGVAIPRDFDLDRYDNSAGADGAMTVQVKQGVFGFQNDGANPILATTQPGTKLYAVDDQTVSLSSNTGARPYVGRLVRLDTSVIGGPVVVEVKRHINASLAGI
jgi:hypothetical protein